MMAPSIVSFCSDPVSRVRPKSSTFTRPDFWSTHRLAGLISRWISPFSCAAARPRNRSRPTRQMAPTVAVFLCLVIQSSSVIPSRNSIAMKGMPRSSPTWWMVTTHSLWMPAAALASRSSRSRASGVAAMAGRITFKATRRLRPGSSALKTNPIAPCPIRDKIRYPPRLARSPATTGGLRKLQSSFGSFPAGMWATLGSSGALHFRGRCPQTQF